MVGERHAGISGAYTMWRANLHVAPHVRIVQSGHLFLGGWVTSPSGFKPSTYDSCQHKQDTALSGNASSGCAQLSNSTFRPATRLADVCVVMFKKNLLLNTSIY